MNPNTCHRGKCLRYPDYAGFADKIGGEYATSRWVYVQA